MDKHSRINYTEEEKRMLLQFYEEGMKSTKKQMADKIRECSARVGISEQQVKNFINNHNAKLHGSSARSHETKKTAKLMRKRSGYNIFTSDVLQEDKSGGSAEAFRSVGQKWRDLSESDKESFKKRAAESEAHLSMPSQDERAKKIVRNIMNEVTELEALGGHYVLLCSFGDEIVHGGSAIGEKIINDKDLLGCFGSLIQSELVQQSGKKMPYVKIGELGIVMEDLHAPLLEEIGKTPRKPSFYGSGQRRKLWETRNLWKLGVSVPTTPTYITTPATSTFTHASTPSTSTSSSPIPSTSTPSGPIPFTSTPSGPIPSTSTPSEPIPSTSTPSAPISSTSTPSAPIPSTSTPSAPISSTSNPSAPTLSTSTPSAPISSTSTPSSPIPSTSTPSAPISSTSTPSSPIPFTSTPSAPIPSMSTSSAPISSTSTPSSPIPSTSTPSAPISSTSTPSAPIPSTSTPSAPISSTSNPSAPTLSTSTPSAPISSTSTPSSPIPSTSTPSAPISSTSTPSSPIPFTSTPSAPIPSMSTSSAPISSTSTPSSPIPSMSISSTTTLSSPIPFTSTPSGPILSTPMATTWTPTTLSVTSDRRRSLLNLSLGSPGVVISEDTQFGMTVPNSNCDPYAVCVLRPRSQIHGRAVLDGNVVVLVKRILRQGLRPLLPGRFDEDEPVSVGGFYEWPCSHLIMMQK